MRIRPLDQPFGLVKGVCDIEVIKEGFMRLVELPNNLQNAR